MATWQFDLVLIPRAAASALPSPLAALEDSRPSWDGHAVSALGHALGPLGPARPTWDAATVMWGIEDQTCITLTTEGEVVDELRVRLDLREPAPESFTRLLDLARAHDWLIATELDDLVEPNLVAVLHATKNSVAARFVEDPRAFLNSLKPI